MNTEVFSALLTQNSKGQHHQHGARKQLLEQKTGKCCSFSLGRDTEFWPTSTHKHASLDRKTSLAVVSFGLHSVTSLYWWGPSSSQLTKTAKACLHLGFPAYPPASSPRVGVHAPGCEFTLTEAELERTSWSNKNTHQSLPETSPHLPPALNQQFLKVNDIQH